MRTDHQRLNFGQTLYGTAIPPQASDRQPLSPTVEQALMRFSQSDRPSLWPHLDKGKVLQQMRDRLQNPFCVSQGQQPFCGPTAILFELIRKQPLRYIEIAQALYEQGFFTTQRKTVAATERLRNSQGNLRTAEADWLILATLRDAENSIFQIDPNAPEFIQQLSGMTKSWEMIGWAKEVLGYRQVRYRHAFMFGDVSAMRWAERSLRRGGVAFLLITAEGLLQKAPMPVTVPNHWIVFLGGLTVEGAKIPWSFRSNRRLSFEVCSWSQRYRIEAPEREYEDLFWGVVVAEP